MGMEGNLLETISGTLDLVKESGADPDRLKDEGGGHT